MTHFQLRSGGAGLGWSGGGKVSRTGNCHICSLFDLILDTLKHIVLVKRQVLLPCQAHLSMSGGKIAARGRGQNISRWNVHRYYLHRYPTSSTRWLWTQGVEELHKYVLCSLTRLDRRTIAALPTLPHAIDGRRQITLHHDLACQRFNPLWQVYSDVRGGSLLRRRTAGTASMTASSWYGRSRGGGGGGGGGRLCSADVDVQQLGLAGRQRRQQCLCRLPHPLQYTINQCLTDRGRTNRHVLQGQTIKGVGSVCGTAFNSWRMPSPSPL